MQAEMLAVGNPSQPGHGDVRLVRADQGCKARPECIREGEPHSQDAGLSSRPTYGKENELM